MWRGIIGATLVTIMATGGRETAAQGEGPSIRAEGAAVRELVESGMMRSATLRALTGKLDQSNVIVYVRFSRCSGAVPACLAWASVTANTRRLVIKIDRFGRSPDQLTALLAHELQHAAEVAADSQITDLTSFERSFASRGWKHGTGFETGEAIDISGRVSAELTESDSDGGVLARRRP